MESDVINVCGLIDNNLAGLVHTIIVILKFGVPLLLVIFGMIDFAKGVIASKEDEIKKGQRVFIKRLILSVIVFFVVTIVQLVVGLVDDSSDSGIWECAQLIMNGETVEIPEKQIADPWSETKVPEKEKDPKEGFLDGTYKDRDADARCCEKLGGEYIKGACYDGDGNLLNDKVDRCVLSGG